MNIALSSAPYFFNTFKFAVVKKNSVPPLNNFNTYFDSLFENAFQNCILLMDEKGVIISINNAFANHFGYNPTEVAGKNVSIFFTDEDIKKKKPEAEIKNVLTYGHASDNNYLVKKDKSITWVAGESILVKDENSTQILKIIQDINVQKELEKDREDIIGFVAHELRNPLANLILCNELLGDLIKENDKEAVDDLLQRSKNSVMKLNKLIGELYDSAKVNSGNLKLEMTIFNFKEMITEAINTIKVLHPSYNIVVTGNDNISINGDGYRLTQVVTNYLSNGIKYSDGNTDVNLDISFDDNSITVSVKDKGFGISQKQLPFVFDRYFRGEKTKNLEGIGLGLFLCRQIIHAHHGKVWAQSEEGKGSAFYFSIPR